MSLTIDPGIVMIPENHQVFVLHPGENKRFYKEFAELKVVFLDFPGANLTDESDLLPKALWPRLRMARAISSWHRRDRPSDKKPSRDLATYSNSVDQAEKPRYLHEFIDLYSKAKTGDIVMVPGPGYTSPVFIGEFRSDFDVSQVVEIGRYPFEKIPVRQVNWLKSDVRKIDFSPRLVRLMQNRAALIRVTNELDLREVFTAAFGNYVWKDTSGNLLRVTKDHVDLNELSRAINLVNYFAAQYFALKKNELEQFLTLDIEEAIDRYYDKSCFGEIDIEIHSPGIIGRVMKAASLAAYVSSMVALSSEGVSAAEAATAKVENSASKSPTICDIQLESDIRQTMEVYAGLDIWEKKNCVKSQRAKREVGLEPDVKIRK